MEQTRIRTRRVRVDILARNHVVIHTEDGNYFQSYDSTIVFIPTEGKTQLGSNWKYSTTTSKHRNKFLNEDTATTQKKLDSGEYVLNEDL